jgi:hypothetical protein
VLSLFLSKNSNGIKCFYVNNGFLPVHYAAVYSSLDVLKFLIKAYPESLSMVIVGEGFKEAGYNLLHLAQISVPYAADVKAIMEYLCNLCPALIHMKCNQGLTPLHQALTFGTDLNMEAIKVLCDIDESVVRDTCTPIDITSANSLQLPLHLLIDRDSPLLEVSKEGDCFRLFLRMYPASAGIRDSHLMRPYDLAISGNLSVYFIRALLNADPTIDPVERCNLNYAARREGMFLAFMALSSNRYPIIWAKIRHEDRNLLTRVISYL